MAANRPPTDAEKVHIESIDVQLLAVMNLCDLHPQVRASLAENGFIFADMVSAAYPSEAELIATVAADFKFDDGDIKTVADAAKGINQVNYTAISFKAERPELILVW